MKGARPLPNGGVPSIPGLILDEARELRRKQDERLRGLQTLSRSILAGFLSAGLIALAAQPAEAPISDEFGLLITYAAVALVIMTLLVELSASRWKEGKLYRSLPSSTSPTKPPAPKTLRCLSR